MKSYLFYILIKKKGKIVVRLKKYHEKKTKNMYILLFASLSILLVAGVLFYKSYAYYEEAKDFDVINGTVEDPGYIYFAY